MSASLAWLCVAAAISVWPSRSGGHATAHGRSDADSAGRRRDRRLTALAVLGVGTVCVVMLGPLMGAVVAVGAGPLVVRALATARRRPARGDADPSLPLALDLAAAALRSGRPVPDALGLAAPAAGPSVQAALVRTARLLELGADAELAWSGRGDLATAGRSGADVVDVLAPVAQLAVRSQHSGVRLADAFERCAAELRTERAARATARAHRAGVQAMGPLAACFLPSFICLGIVPVIAGIAATVLRSVT